MPASLARQRRAGKPHTAALAMPGTTRGPLGHGPPTRRWSRTFGATPRGPQGRGPISRTEQQQLERVAGTVSSPKRAFLVTHPGDTTPLAHAGCAGWSKEEGTAEGTLKPRAGTRGQGRGQDSAVPSARRSPNRPVHVPDVREASAPEPQNEGTHRTIESPHRTPPAHTRGRHVFQPPHGTGKRCRGAARAPNAHPSRNSAQRLSVETPGAPFPRAAPQPWRCRSARRFLAGTLRHSHCPQADPRHASAAADSPALTRGAAPGTRTQRRGEGRENGDGLGE